MFFPAVCHNILEFSSRVLVVGRSRYSTAKFPTRFHQRAKREIIGTCPRPHEVNADMTIVFKHLCNRYATLGWPSSMAFPDRRHVDG